MRAKAAITLALSLILVLAGCTPSDSESGAEKNSGMLSEHHYTLSNGKTVTCIVLGSYRGGISCDWEGATR